MKLAEQYMNAVQRFFSAARGAQVQGSFQILFPDQSGIHLNVNQQVCAEVTVQEADVTIRLRRVDLRTPVAGLEEVEQLFVDGNAMVEGRQGLAACLPDMISSAKTQREPVGESARLLELFPSPVAVSTFNGDLSGPLEYIQRLDYVKRGAQQLSRSQNRQSAETFILDAPELNSISHFIESQLAAYSQHVLGTSQALCITQSWVNISGKGDSHHEHTHPNSVVSGVFYMKMDSSLPPIRFHDGSRPEIVPEIKTRTRYNARYATVSLNAGELILFPSTLVHSVPTNVTDATRISLSFNTFPIGALGSRRSLTYLPVSVDR